MYRQVKPVLSILVTALVLLFCVTHIATPVMAHEVYVLDSYDVSTAVTTTSPNPFEAISSHELQFLGWGVLSIIVLLVVLRLSVSKLFERVFDPFLMRLKKYAPFVGRITLGISLIFSGYFGGLFGPELPLSQVLSPDTAELMSIFLMIIGFCITIGMLTRLMSFIVLCVFVYAVTEYQTYMLMYVNYLGEALLFLVLGGGHWSVDKATFRFSKYGALISKISKQLEDHSFLILRVFFGLSLFSASYYAKFLHSNLALNTVNEYHLTNYFHFTPLFLVLGAFIIEALIGICFATGLEIRFMNMFFTVFLILSLIFFGEVVWPHIILFGVNLTLFFHGYDRYTLEMAVFQRGRKGEPVL